MKLESQLQVYTASGVAPFTVNQSTLVSNLNAQYLNGQLGGYYAAASSLASYLPLAGGTLTGGLTVSTQLSVLGATATDILRLYVTGSTIWKLGVTDASGSALNISADFGSFTINKSTGTVTTPGAFASTVVTGTAPLTVASTTLVSNLNVQYLNGQLGGYYQNAGNLTAGTLLAARLPAFTGDVTSTVGTVALTLAASGATAGTYNNVTVNAKGLVTGGSNTSYLTSNQSVSITGDATGSGSTGIVLTLANVLATPGTYTKVTVNAKGLITAGASLASADLPTYTGTITSGQVTTGLGFTPYNATNPSGYITSSASITGYSGGVSSSDTRSVVTTPQTINAGVVFDFKTNTTDSLSDGGSYFGEMTFRPYGSGTDWTGTISHQLGFTDAGNIWQRSGSSTTWAAWKKMLDSSNYSSYALPLSGGTLTGALNGTTAAFTGAVTQGGNQVLHAGNYTSYTLPRGGGWYGASLPGTRWGGFSVNGGEIVFGQDLPAVGQMGILIDGCYIAAENNGFWSLASSNDWTTRRGMYFDGTYLRFDYNSATAYFSNASIGGNQVLHAGNYTSYPDTTKLPLAGGTLTGGLSGTTGYFSSDVTWIGYNSGNPRSARLGYSGGNYGSVSYGINYTATTASHTYAFNDAVTRIDLADGIQVYSAAAAVAGTAVSWTTLLEATRGNGNLRWKGNTVLDSNNYNSYALPLSGGTMAGNIILPASRYIGLSGGSTYGIGVLANTNSGVFDTLESTGSDPLELNYYQGGPVKIGSGTNGSKSLYAVGIYDNGNAVLTSASTSAPSLSIGGSAATATRTSSQSGYAHAGTGMVAFYNWGGTSQGTNAPDAGSYTIGISVGSHPNDQAYGFQIANNMWASGLWTRNYNSGFGSWVRLLDSSNYTSYPDATKLPLTGGTLTGGITATNHIGPGTGLTGTAASLTAGAVPWSGITSKPTTISGFGIIDIVSSNSGSPVAADTTTKNGFYYVNSNISLFSATDGALFVQAYDNTWASQIFQDYRTGQIAIRGRNNGTWQAWRSVLDSTNASYAWNMNQSVGSGNSPSFTGLSVINTITGAVSGSSGSCTGNAATATSATYLNSSNYINRCGSSGNANTDFNNTPAGTVRHLGDDANVINSPGATWWFYDNYRHSNGSNYWGTQVAWGWEDNANKLATRNVTGGTFGSWVYYLNSVNYNSYVLAASGSAASLSIGGSSGSCTGNAATVTNGVYTGTTNNITGQNYFLSNLGTTSGAINSPPLQASSTGTNAAFMSFHRQGNYAVNFGLDSDNVLRIGGWSASANRWQLDMSGNETIAGTMTAINFSGLGTGLTGTASGLNIGGNANNITQYTINQSVGTGNSPSFTGLSVINTITGAVSGSSGSCTGNAASASAVAASGITGQTGMWTSAARPGPYRLYRRDVDDAYSVQNYWTGSYWRLDGYYSNNTVHAGCSVSYADAAGSSASCSGSAAQLNGQAASYFENRDVTAVGISAGTLTLTRANGNMTTALGGRTVAWVEFDGNMASTGYPNGSYNVSSITKNATGDYTINFQNSLATGNYVVAGTAQMDTTAGATNYNLYIGVARRSGAKSAASCRIGCEYPSGQALYNSGSVGVAFIAA